MAFARIYKKNPRIPTTCSQSHKYTMKRNCVVQPLLPTNSKSLSTQRFCGVHNEGTTDLRNRPVLIHRIGAGRNTTPSGRRWPRADLQTDEGVYAFLNPCQSITTQIVTAVIPRVTIKGSSWVTKHLCGESKEYGKKSVNEIHLPYSPLHPASGTYGAM